MSINLNNFVTTDSKSFTNHSPELLLDKARYWISSDIKIPDTTWIKLGNALIDGLILRMSGLTGNYDNSSIFWSNFLMFIERDIRVNNSKYAAAVSIDKLGNPKLHINISLFVSICKDIKNAIAILEHEGHHLLFQHPILFEELSTHGYHKAVNIGCDTEINQYVKNLPDGTMTLKKYESITKQKEPAYAGSNYYVYKIIDVPFDEDDDDENNESSSIDSFDFCDTTSWSEDDNNDNLGGSLDNSSNEDYANSDTIISTTDTKTLALENLTEITDLAIQQTEEMLSKNESIFGRGRGSVPSYIIESLDALKNTKAPEISWKRLVKKMIGQLPSGYRPSISRMNRRQPYRIDKLGSISDTNLKHIIVGVDSSASVSKFDLEVIFSDIWHLVNLENVELDLVTIDVEIHSVKRIKKRKDLDLSIQGRGGTCMQPIFDWLNASKLSKKIPIIIFTDGYVEDTIETYGYNSLLWVIVNSRKFENIGHTSGKIVYINTKE